MPLVDGHNDVPWELRQRVKNHLAQLDLRSDTSALEKPMHTDIARLRKGGVGGQFWSVYIPADLAGPQAVRTVMEQIDVVHRLAARYPDVFEIATSRPRHLPHPPAGKIASLIGMEGGHSIDNSLGVLRQLYDAGARYMTITHSKNVDWADSATDAPKHGGLTKFGEEVIREMNRLGMLVDLSHVSPDTMKDAMAVSEAPVIFSHSSARALDAHPRNVPDDVLRLLPQDGGVVMVTFVPSFVSEEVRAWNSAGGRGGGAPEGAPSRRSEAGRDRPGDLDARSIPCRGPRSRRWPTTSSTSAASRASTTWASAPTSTASPACPSGLEGVDDYPVLLAELLRRGWTDEDDQEARGPQRAARLPRGGKGFRAAAQGAAGVGRADRGAGRHRALIAFRHASCCRSTEGGSGEPVSERSAPPQWR